MKVAVTVWQDTVATVCDFSSRLLMLDVTDGEVQKRSVTSFEPGRLPEKANQLKTLGAEVLLCGAISKPLERMIRASGVLVIPCLRGSIEEVVGAYLADGLSDARFILPGFGPRAGRVPRRTRRRRGSGGRWAEK